MLTFYLMCSENRIVFSCIKSMYRVAVRVYIETRRIASALFYFILFFVFFRFFIRPVPPKHSIQVSTVPVSDGGTLPADDQKKLKEQMNHAASESPPSKETSPESQKSNEADEGSAQIREEIARRARREAELEAEIFGLERALSEATTGETIALEALQISEQKSQKLESALRERTRLAVIEEQRRHSIAEKVRASCLKQSTLIFFLFLFLSRTRKTKEIF